MARTTVVPAQGASLKSPHKPLQDKGKKKATKKRKADESESDSGDEDGGTDTEFVDVSFTFTPPLSLDFHTFKQLLTQLLSSLSSSEELEDEDDSTPTGDGQFIDFGALADEIIAQKKVGNCVRVDEGDDEEEEEEEDEEMADGTEKEDELDETGHGDPYGFLTVLNATEKKGLAHIKTLLSSLHSRAPSSSTSSTSIHSVLSSLLNPSSSSPSSSSLGLVLGERLVNMPIEVVPQLYRLLNEDLQTTTTSSFNFEYLLFLSRVYVLPSTSTEHNSDNPKKKRKNQGAAATNDSVQQTFSYHAETSYIEKFAIDEFTTALPSGEKKRRKRTTGGSVDDEEEPNEIPGVETALKVMLVPWDRFGDLVEGMAGWIGGGGNMGS